MTPTPYSGDLLPLFQEMVKEGYDSLEVGQAVAKTGENFLFYKTGSDQHDNKLFWCERPEISIPDSYVTTFNNLRHGKL